MSVTIHDIPGYDTEVEVHYSHYSDDIWKNIEKRIIDGKWHWSVKADVYNKIGRELSRDGDADSPEDAAEQIEVAIKYWKEQ